MCLARNPTMDLDETTDTIPEVADPEKLLKACEGYDHRIAKNLDHGAFFDKVILEKDVDEEKRIQERADAGADVEESGSSFSWDDSAKGEGSRKADTAKEGTVPSPAKEAEK